MILADTIFVLPADVIVIPVAQLAPDIARRTPAGPDDVAITRPRGRAPSCIVDKNFAAFVQEFRSPKKIARAIVDYGRLHDLDCDALLDGALPLLARLIDARFLVPVDSPSRSARSVKCADDWIGSLRVLDAVSVTDDTEVYQVMCPNGTVAALKIAADANEERVRLSFEREAAVLARLDGRVNPRLQAAGTEENRSYLLLDWCAGEPISAVASRVRAFESPAVLRELAVQILDAFAHLHGQGIVHGDVHPGNVLCAKDAVMTVLDFGLAAGAELSLGTAPRGGVGFFFEPEFIRSQGRLGATARGEQYALAALIFRLLTGEDYLDFSLERETAFGQILEQAPRAFADCGAPAWPGVETILRKALRKEPSARFASVADFARELAGVPVISDRPPRRGRMPDARRYVADAVASIGIGSPLARIGVPEAPTASVTFGAAGIALACVRIACVRDDPALLALAEFWSAQTLAASDVPAAFWSKRLGLSPATLGNVSPYHTASGLHAVRFLIATAGGDAIAAAAALAAFVDAGRADCERLDVMLGISGILVTIAVMLDAGRNDAGIDVAPLIDLGDRIAHTLWTRLDLFGEIGADAGSASLGTAHGWAGFLYATLSWSLVASRPLPFAVARRLDELAALREPCGSGSRWRVACPGNGSVPFTSGWCNGSAGHVFTWTAAYTAIGEDRFLAYAEEAAWNAWESSPGSGNLCCGDAGRAYALLNFYRASNDSRWLRRAERLAFRAMDVAGGVDSDRSRRGESLYKGALGVAVLIADLAEPAYARMPLFERDGPPLSARVERLV